MAKKSSIEKNNRRRRMAKQYADRRARLKEIAHDNRCELSGRPRAYYRKHKLSRIALRELGSKGLIPGLVKSSW
jgi:small subunit ribosomal protein S14